MKLLIRTLALSAAGLSLSALGEDPAAARIHAAFQVANTDGNSILDRKEARRFGLAEESLKGTDARDAGQLDEQQFSAAVAQQFARADHDRDGNLDPKEMHDADVCCGFGGTFCVKYPDISNTIVTKKAEHVAATGAQTLLAGDLGCLMNMAGRLQRLGKPVRARHIAEVLAGMNEPAIGER